MSENSGGFPNPVPPEQSCYCKECQQPLSPPDALFCFRCGASQQDIQKKQCLLCPALLLPNAQYCMFCAAPQDPQLLSLTPLKQCINPQCSALLVATLSVCYNCRWSQAQEQNQQQQYHQEQEQQTHQHQEYQQKQFQSDNNTTPRQPVQGWDNQPPEVSISYPNPLVSSLCGAPHYSHLQGTSSDFAPSSMILLLHQDNQDIEIPTSDSYSQNVTSEQVSVVTHSSGSTPPQHIISKLTSEGSMEMSHTKDDQPIDHVAMDVDHNIETQIPPTDLPTLPSVDSTINHFPPPLSASSSPPLIPPLPPTPSSLLNNGKRQSLADEKVIDIPEKKRKAEVTGSSDGSSATSYSTEKEGTVQQKKVVPSGNSKPVSDPSYEIQCNQSSFLSPSNSSALTTKVKLIPNNQMVFGSASGGQSFSVSPQLPTSLQLSQVPDNEVTSQSECSLNPEKVENDKTKAELLRPMIHSELNKEYTCPKEELNEGVTDISKQNQERKRRKTDSETDQDETQPPMSKRKDSNASNGTSINVDTHPFSTTIVVEHSCSHVTEKTKASEKENQGSNDSVNVSEIPARDNNNLCTPLSFVPEAHRLRLESTSPDPPYIGAESDSDHSISSPSLQDKIINKTNGTQERQPDASQV